MPKYSHFYFILKIIQKVFIVALKVIQMSINGNFISLNFTAFSHFSTSQTTQFRHKLHNTRDKNMCQILQPIWELVDCSYKTFNYHITCRCYEHLLLAFSVISYRKNLKYRILSHAAIKQLDNFTEEKNIIII